MDFKDYKYLMRKARKGYVRPMPKNLSELGISLEGYEPLKKFYRGYAVASDGSISLIFITNHMVLHLRRLNNKIDEFFMDRTFAVCFFNFAFLENQYNRYLTNWNATEKFLW